MVFLIASVVVLNLTVIFMPKKLSASELWTTALFASVFQLLADYYLDAKLHLYGYFTKEIDWLALIPMFGLYPAARSIFLNFYPESKSKVARIGYIVCWWAFCLVFEAASVKSGYFFYAKWKLWYSAICYPILLCVLLVHFRIVQKLPHRSP